MSEILTLAKDYEAKLKQQAQTTRESVQSALAQHESALLECLNAEQKTIENAIRSHSRRTNKSLATSWLATVAVLCSTIALAMAVLWWQGSEIANRYEQLEKLPSAQVKRCGEQSRLCVEIDPKASAYGENGQYRVIKGG